MIATRAAVGTHMQVKHSIDDRVNPRDCSYEETIVYLEDLVVEAGFGRKEGIDGKS
jgi:hypothetical protein